MSYWTQIGKRRWSQSSCWKASWSKWDLAQKKASITSCIIGCTQPLIQRAIKNQRSWSQSWGTSIRTEWRRIGGIEWWLMMIYEKYICCLLEKKNFYNSSLFHLKLIQVVGNKFRRYYLLCLEIWFYILEKILKILVFVPGLHFFYADLRTGARRECRTIKIR